MLLKASARQGYFQSSFESTINKDLSNNKFSCDVPDLFRNLKGQKLLNLSYNELSGNIPQSFGDLESIEILDLSDKNISGTIPQSFQKLN
ncbi:hypothetical protein ACET3Z_031945 [Daucus carota]